MVYMARRRKGPSLVQVEERLRQSTGAILGAEKRQKRLQKLRARQSRRQEGLEKPLAEGRMRIMRDTKSEEVGLGFAFLSRGKFDGKRFVVLKRTVFPQGVKGPYSKRIARYIYDKNGRLVFKVPFLKESAMERMKMSRRKEIMLGKNWTGIFDGNNFRVRETVKTGKSIRIIDYIHDLDGDLVHVE